MVASLSSWGTRCPKMPPMTSPSHDELERKVQQHDNDILAIYGMLSRIETTVRSHTDRFDQIDVRLDQHDARFDQHDARFDQHDARFDQHDARFDQHDARFDQIDAKLDEVLRRLEP